MKLKAPNGFRSVANGGGKSFVVGGEERPFRSNAAGLNRPRMIVSNLHCYRKALVQGIFVKPGYGSLNAVSRTACMLELSAPKFSQGLHAQAHSKDGPAAPMPSNDLHERARFLG
jgi:hypothetical protein